MAKSLINELPKTEEYGRRESQRIFERINGDSCVGLRTKELLLPAKDISGSREKYFAGKIMGFDSEWVSHVVYRDNLLFIQVLLTGDESIRLPSFHGGINLIYIEQSFDLKTGGRIKIILPGFNIEQKPTIIKQFAYANTWKDGAMSCLKFYIQEMMDNQSVFNIYTNHLNFRKMKRFFLVAIVCMAGAAAMHAQEKVPALKVGSEVPVALKSGLVIELNGADGIIIEGKKYPLGMSFGGVMANSGDVSNVIVENADMKIWISDGTLYVESSKQSIGLIQVYSVTGQLVKNINATGQNLVTETLGLARGFYIVKIGAKTYKLMNK